jgi:hypothetical protein
VEHKEKSMRKVLLAGGLFAFPVLVNVGQITAKADTAVHDSRLRKIEQFFADRDCPLRDSAAVFLEAADRNDLDWRLLPSISMVESSGGKDYRNNNVFGWDSCRESFSSVGEGIHYVASQLANSKLYKNKNLDGKLRTYNANPDYPHRVKAFMRVMDPGEKRRTAMN